MIAGTKYELDDVVWFIDGDDVRKGFIELGCVRIDANHRFVSYKIHVSGLYQMSYDKAEEELYATKEEAISVLERSYAERIKKLRSEK